MRIVLQRVKKASVKVNDEIIGEIGKGYLLLVGFCKDFKEEMLGYFVNKILNLRVFEDDKGKTNLSIKEINGEILVVSQFTLCAKTKKGSRPSFDLALKKDLAKKYYSEFIELLKKKKIVVKSGIFGEYMQVQLINDGPFTINLQKFDNDT
ncbi:D-tyrosyl-tRNA(Tyr) deacylase [bacterium]|nr:D-tyrosyl-tRNA(Tyr) deacylase [bacterium]